MGYPGDERPPSPYGEWPANTPPGQYGGGDPYGPGAAGASGGHDPFRGYPPLNDPQGPPPGEADTPYNEPPTQIGGGPQSPYGPPPGPYGQPQQPYAEQPGFGGYGPPSGPQQPGQPGPPAWQGPPGGYGGPPGGPSGGGGNGKMLLVIGGIAAVVVLLGGGGTALAFALKKDPPKPPPAPTAQPTQSPTEAAPTPTPTDTSTSPSGGRWLKLAKRSTDPRPITVSEMFGKSRVSKSGHSYRLVAKKATRSCASAITGSRLRSAMSAGNCTQVLRGTYLRSDGKVMGTVSISNLDDYPDVRKAFLAARGGQQYVTPLRGPGRTAKLGRGAALGIRQVKGHYLLLSWVQYTDGHRPSGTAGRKQLANFHDDVVSGAFSSPLGFRMITGRPR